jgi:hypothetical protein
MATISLFPNPATDYFQISGIEDSAHVTISDLNCIPLLKKEITTDEKISVSTLRKGVYVAKITTPTYTIERKLVKE